MCRDGRGSALVFVADSASADTQRKAHGKYNFCGTNTHYLAPGVAPDWTPLVAGGVCAAGAGVAGFWVMSLTLTCCPSSRESAGLTTIQSAAVIPCKSSRVVP